MIPRVSSLEDAKDLSSQQRIQPRVSTLKVLKTLMMFLVLGVGFSLFSLYMTRHFTVQNMVMQVRTTCFDEQTTLERWIRPPQSLLHSMSDEELLWRASFVPQVKKYPYQRVPKIAFMFLTPRPLPLSPLWDRFFSGHEGLYSIYIHALPTYVANFSSSSGEEVSISEGFTRSIRHSSSLEQSSGGLVRCHHSSVVAEGWSGRLERLQAASLWR